MKRNAEHTKERILEAAFNEFSAYGIAGARVDRIAAQAGCNKNLIYIYFEHKEQLFKTVLHQQLRRIYDDILFTPDDLPAYAGRVFDFAMAQPELMRLLAWANLEEAEESSLRSTSVEGKLADLNQVYPESAGLFSPGFILVTVVSLATAWSATNPFGRVYTPGATQQPDQLRAQIRAAVEVLTASPAVHLENRPTI